jgi:hemolysin III
VSVDPRRVGLCAWRTWRARWGISRADVANAISHGLAVPAGIVGTIILTLRSLRYEDVAHTVAVTVYGASLVAVLTASTLYHGTAARRQRLKNAFLWLDHSCIYALIAGTYTPFMLTVLKGFTGTTMLVTVWALAVLGVLSKTAIKIRALRADAVSIPIYVGMGWLIVLAIGPFVEAMEPAGIALLLAGGLCYSLGLVFFVLRRVYAHFLWHLMVLAGGGFHYASVFLYATPR